MNCKWCDQPIRKAEEPSETLNAQPFPSWWIHEDGYYVCIGSRGNKVATATPEEIRNEDGASAGAG